MCCCVNRLFPHSVTDTTIGTHAHTPHTLNKFTDTLWVIVCLFGLSLASQMHKTNISYLLTLHVSVYWSVILLPLLYYKFDIWTSTFSFFYYFSVHFFSFFPSCDVHTWKTKGMLPLAYNRIYFCPNPSFSFSPICVFLLFFATKIIYVSQFSVK